MAKRLVPISGHFKNQVWINPYIQKRSGPYSDVPLAGRRYRVDYRTKFSSNSPWISGSIVIRDDDLPKKVVDRDLNGEFGYYIRNRLSIEWASRGINIPPYDIALRMSGGVGDYTAGPATPLDPNRQFSFMND